MMAQDLVHEAHAVRRRMRELCATLRRLADYLCRNNANDSVRHVARTLCSRFDAELAHHAIAQEHTIFPDLLTALPLARGGQRRFVASLEREHRSMCDSWAHLRWTLWDMSLGRPAALSRQDATRFAQLCADHAAREGGLLLTLGTHCCD